MKKLMSFLIIVLLTVIAGCGLITLHDESFGELRLVPLSTNDLAKAITDENGQMWLPKSELSAVLAKATAIDINFDEILATKTLQYVIMNVGNQDVFDVNINAQDLYIYPQTIGLIKAFGQDIGLSALPIVNVIKKHVIPVDGIGMLLDMEVGPFIDTLSLQYSYILDSDTIDVVDKYNVIGEKMGAIVNIICSNKPILNYVSTEGNNERTISVYYNLVLHDSLVHNGERINISNISPTIRDTTIVVNNGNCDVRLRITDSMDEYTIFDSTLYAGDSMDISRHLINLPESSIVIKLGPSPNIINFIEAINLEGFIGLLLSGL